MRYSRSYCNFSQYKPYQSRWQKFLNRLKRKKENRFAFQREEKISWRRPERNHVSPVKLIILVLAGLFLLWLGLIIYLPYFRINKISYTGLNIIKKEEIDQDVKNKFFIGSKFWPAGNYFFTSAPRIQNYLKSKYSVNDVVVEKKFPSEIVINVAEKISSIIYDNGYHYYLLDQSGAVIKDFGEVGRGEYFAKIASATTTTSTETKKVSTKTKIPAATSTDIFGDNYHVPDYLSVRKNFGPFPVLYDTRHLVASSSVVAIEPAVITAALKWAELMVKQGIGLKYLSVGNPLAGMEAHVNPSLIIYFNPLENLDIQSGYLKDTLHGFHPTEYINLRYGGRVIWK